MCGAVQPCQIHSRGRGRGSSLKAGEILGAHWSGTVLPCARGKLETSETGSALSFSKPTVAPLQPAGSCPGQRVPSAPTPPPPLHRSRARLPALKHLESPSRRLQGVCNTAQMLPEIRRAFQSSLKKAGLSLVSGHYFFLSPIFEDAMSHSSFVIFH